MRPSHALAATIVLWLGAPHAHAQLFADDEARRAIIDLRTELRAKAERLEATQLDLLRQIEQLRADQAALRGSLEQTGQTTNTTRQQQKELFESLEKQIQRLEGRLGQVEPKTVEIDGKTLSVQPDELAAYEKARGLMGSGDLAGAVKTFQQMMQRFPGSALYPWALFHEGVSQYALKHADAAIKSLSQLTERYSSHPRTPDAMLTLASALAESGKSAQARSTLQSVMKRFPGTEQAKTASTRLKTLGRAGKP